MDPACFTLTIEGFDVLFLDFSDLLDDIALGTDEVLLCLFPEFLYLIAVEVRSLSICNLSVLLLQRPLIVVVVLVEIRVQILDSLGHMGNFTQFIE